MDAGNILIIDDSWVVLDRLRAALSAKGYSVRVAAQPGEAARHVSWAELCVVDFHMPGLDGAQLLPMLRSATKDSGCMFYLYTNDNDVGRRYDALGFEGAFLKKGDEDALLPQVEAAFRTIKLKKLAGSLRDKRRESKT